MKKKIFAIFMLVIILVFNLSIIVSAAKLQDPYEAYGLKKGNADIAGEIYLDPPSVIVLKPISISYAFVTIPLDMEEITLNKGKSTKFTLSATGTNTNANSKATITSDIEFRYAMEKDPRILFALQHETHLLYEDTAKTRVITEETAKNLSFSGGFGGHDEGELRIAIALARNSGVGNVGTITFKFVGVEHKKSLGSIIIDSDASDTKGETSVPIPTAIVIGLIGAAVAVVGAGAVGAGTAAVGMVTADSSSESGKESDGSSTYKMCIYKDFGDKIKYGGETVFVHARMVEVTAEGVEIERFDLTQQIEIFSQDSFLSIGISTTSGAYMGASVSATAEKQTVMPEEGTISFKFNGESGIFQNNLKFKMVGECHIEIAGQNLFVLAASGNSFELPYSLLDFMGEAKVKVETMQKACPVKLSVGKNKDGKTVIIAIDDGEKKPFEKFFENYNCEIIAQNDKEYARSIFDVVLCHEGLLPDFLGKPHEIRGYKNEAEEMEETLIAFKLGIWNDSDKTLDFIMPEEICIDCIDKGGIFEVIGLDYTQDTDSVRTDAVIYTFKAKISLPAPEPIKGELTASCKYGEKIFENKTGISLIPDVQEYYDNLEQEYEKCIYIINTYLPESWRAKKLEHLEKARACFGIKDYKLFRKNCWLFAQNLILQEKENYLKQSYSADIAIAYLEIYVYIGDVAFDIALMPVGGPIAGFLIAQAKSTVLELISMRIEKGNIGFDELTELIMKRIEQMSGQADGAVAMPKPSEPKKLATWLACFFLYRFVWHWYWSKDENNNSVGITGALEKAAFDFAGKAVAGMLGNFVDKLADKSSFAQVSKTIYNKSKDDALSKPVTDVGDKAFSSLIEVLTSYLDKIKNGLV